MTITREQAEALAKPFPADAVDWRVVSTTRDKKRGQVAFYINARDVMNRLDDAVGAENWSDRMLRFDDKHICCRLTVLGVTHDGIGAANEGGMADGLKGAESDALKRAAVKFGIARYLYEGRRLWVELDEHQQPATNEIRRIRDAHNELVKGFVAGNGHDEPEAAQQRRDAVANAGQPRQEDVDAALERGGVRPTANGATRPPSPNWSKFWRDVGALRPKVDAAGVYAAAGVQGPMEWTHYTQDDVDALLAKLKAQKENAPA